MDQDNSPPQKPISQKVRPEITRLPQITFWRRIFRSIINGLGRFLIRLLVKLELDGAENVPADGKLIMVSNHLGDADFVIGIAFSPRPLDPLVKSELYDLPLVGRLLDAYGVIWIHRGRPDKRALRAALKGLQDDRVIAIAPEGRESLTGQLEEGTHGAAFLALKTDAPILPISFVGTENCRLIDNLKRLRRARMRAVIGPPFRLPQGKNRREALEQGTQIIMKNLASQLPPEYRGVYQDSVL